MQCPGCQHENPVGAKFCNEYATPLIGLDPHGAERRQLTVMFCDLAGDESVRHEVDASFEALTNARQQANPWSFELP